MLFSHRTVLASSAFVVVGVAAVVSLSGCGGRSAAPAGASTPRHRSATRTATQNQPGQAAFTGRVTPASLASWIVTSSTILSYGSTVGGEPTIYKTSVYPEIPELTIL